MNLSRSDGGYVDLNSKTPEVQQAHFRIFCDANPLKVYMNAVINLYARST